MPFFPKITFIGAGTAVSVKNIASDLLRRAALAGSTNALIDNGRKRIKESEIVVKTLIDTLRVPVRVVTHFDQSVA